jgi:hypothetical protein
MPKVREKVGAICLSKCVRISELFLSETVSLQLGKSNGSRSEIRGWHGPCQRIFDRACGLCAFFYRSHFTRNVPLFSERSSQNPITLTMARGSKSSYSSKQKRKATHIEKGYEKRGVSKHTAEARAWATVNKEDGGAKGKSKKSRATKSKSLKTKSSRTKSSKKSPSKKR